MIGKLFMFFILLPVAELYLLMKIGAAVGAGNTFLLIVATGFAGSILYRTQSRINFREISENMHRGILPQKELFDRLLILLGAVLLVTPGVLTDSAGLLLLLPFTRPAIRKYFKRWIEKKVGERVEYQTL